MDSHLIATLIIVLVVTVVILLDEMGHRQDSKISAYLRAEKEAEKHYARLAKEQAARDEQTISDANEWGKK